jgi:hypothetical protein
VFVAAFDAAGPRPFILTERYRVTWAAESPQSVSLVAVSGADTVSVRLDFTRRFVAVTGGGEVPLFGADDAATSVFYQLEGRATLTGRLDGKALRETGHAYAETFSAR